MAKLLSGKTTITLDNEYQGVTIYDAPYVSVSSMDKGMNYSIVTDTAKQVPTPTVRRTSAPVTLPDPVDEATRKAEESMIRSARNAERSVLEAASIVADAQREAQQTIADANLLFDKAILAYLHTGKGNVEASKVLEAAGVWATEDRTEAVACFQLDKLYGVDNLETGL